MFSPDWLLLLKIEVDANKGLWNIIRLEITNIGEACCIFNPTELKEKFMQNGSNCFILCQHWLKFEL